MIHNQIIDNIIRTFERPVYDIHYTSFNHSILTLFIPDKYPVGINKIGERIGQLKQEFGIIVFHIKDSYIEIPCPNLDVLNRVVNWCIDNHYLSIKKNKKRGK